MTKVEQTAKSTCQAESSGLLSKVSI